jgi:hypothetical protein
MEEVKRFVGIDVAKAALDVFIGSGGGAFSVANDEVGIRELLRQLTPADFVILEATGGLEVPVASALAQAGLAVCHCQSQTGAGLCSCHWQAGQDRPAGCRDTGALW